MYTKGRLKGFICIFFISLFLFNIMAEVVYAQENSTNFTRKIVKIGYPIQSKLTGKTRDGDYVGYNVDYMKEVAKYTNWDIRYVEVEGDINTQLTTLSDMLDRGEIDMMGTMIMNDYLQELYLYPTYSYGSTYTALVVAENSSYWSSDNFSDWNGMKVATYPGLKRRMALLEQFAHVSGFTYDEVECESLDGVVKAVYEGKADACLQVDINVEAGMRAIARFSPTPYYFAINKNREDLLKELNSAMYSLMEAYPSLQSELYSKYFMRKGSFRLSREDIDWVEDLPPVRVLYFTGSSPIQDRYEDQPTGVAASFISQLSKATGLKTEAVFANSYEEGEKLIADGQVDIVAAMTSNSDINTKYGIHLSNPYFESSTVRARQESYKGKYTPHYYSVNAEGALRDLKTGKMNCALIDNYCVEYYMRKGHLYDESYVEWANKELMLYSVGILPHVDSRLAGIINGFAGSLTGQTKQTMLYNASQQPLTYTFTELVTVYKWQIVSIIITLLMLAFFIALRYHSHLVKESAKQAESLYQFSCMVNECLIRYDVDNDSLIVQNSKLMFKDRNIIKHFLKVKTENVARDENEKNFLSHVKEMLKDHISSRELKLKENGEPVWCRIDMAHINNDYAIGRLYTIEEEVRKREELERKATIDALTGIMNRASIGEFIRNYLKDNRNGVFILMDLDNFKKVNDTMGHLEGDKVLKTFAEYLKNSFEEEDLKARLGGDEFVVFMPHGVSRADLEDKLSKFMSEVGGKIFEEYKKCNLSVSIGAAYIVKESCGLEDLYVRADKAMYNAKYNGKNQYFVNWGAEE